MSYTFSQGGLSLLVLIGEISPKENFWKTHLFAVSFTNYFLLLPPLDWIEMWICCLSECDQNPKQWR